MKLFVLTLSGKYASVTKIVRAEDDSALETEGKQEIAKDDAFDRYEISELEIDGEPGTLYEKGYVE